MRPTGNSGTSSMRNANIPALKPGQGPICPSPHGPYTVKMKQARGSLVPVISVDRTADKPLHQQIYDGYRAAILAGNLRAGQQVPSTRALAQELRVSRIP